MQITDILGQTGGLQSIAKELGINESQAAAGAAALAPAILGGFKKQAQAQPGGLEGLGGLHIAVRATKANAHLSHDNQRQRRR